MDGRPLYRPRSGRSLLQSHVPVVRARHTLGRVVVAPPGLAPDAEDVGGSLADVVAPPDGEVARLGGLGPGGPGVVGQEVEEVPAVVGSRRGNVDVRRPGPEGPDDDDDDDTPHAAPKPPETTVTQPVVRVLAPQEKVDEGVRVPQWG